MVARGNASDRPEATIASDTIWPMEYSLRPARADETDWLYELNKESYHDVVVRQFGAWKEAFQRELFFNESRRARRAEIVEVNGERVGVVILERRSSYDWLQEIQLKPHRRGQGLGTLILHRLLDDARCRTRPLRLQVLHENHRAKRLYERIGFREIEMLENHCLMEIE